MELARSGPHLLPWREIPAEGRDHITIRLIGDLHIGSPLMDEAKLLATIREIADEGQYWIGAGDMFDMANKRQKHGAIYEQVLRPKAQIDYFVEQFAPIASRCLGLIQGNHDGWVTNEYDLAPVAFAAHRLDILDRYAHDGLLVRIKTGTVNRNGGRRIPSGTTACRYTLYVTHGTSGAALVGGKALALSRAGQGVIADVICGAHVHSEIVFKQLVYVPQTHDREDCSYREMTYVNCASFLRWGGYALSARYGPQPTGAASIHLDTTRERVSVTV